MTIDQKVALWNSINEYATACGGDTGNATVSDRRMAAVVAVEREVEETEEEAGVKEGSRWATALLDALSDPSAEELREIREHNPELAAAIRKLKKMARASDAE